MNIVQLPRRFTRTHWGGTETYVLEVSKRLLRRGHGTTILCPNALAACDAEVMHDVPVRRMPYFYPYLRLNAQARKQLDLCGGSLFSFDLLRALWAFPQLDLIHLHTGRRPGAIGRYVALKRRIPYVVSVHGGVFDVPADEEARRQVTRGAIEWGKVLGWWVGSRRVMEDAAAILCVGKTEYRKTLERFPRKRVLYMPNGVDAERYRHGDGLAFRKRWKIGASARVVMTVGRIDPQKNQKVLLELLPRLRQSHPDAHLLIVGHVTHETYYGELLRLVASLPDGSVTIIPGLDPETNELVDAYHAADCFVLPSVHEPFGIVILEAWASGLPVVANAVGGIPGFVEDGCSGLLCDPQDSGSLLHSISTVLAQFGLSRELAERGRRTASNDYSWERVTQRLIGLYEELVYENTHGK